jgi:hypothetical protein
MPSSVFSRRTVQLRSRILGLVGSGLLIAACGGDTQDATPSGDAGGVGGSGGSSTGGVAGSSTGGVAGVGGDAAVDSGTTIQCFDDAQLASYCTPAADGGYTPWSCWNEGGKLDPDAGMWDPDAGSTCPDSILPNNGADCSSYTQPSVQNGECCYVYYPGGGGCGRPFTVAGDARRAPAVERDDWRAPSNGSSTGLDAATRESLASAWLEDARFEHASVASFARFSLELMAFGAPADLLLEAQRAASDEVEHARLCFGLASRYAERDLGPGRLCLDGGLEPVSLAEAAARAASEGCVEETISALLAAAQLERAVDAGVKSALGRIVDDELRHAELAWRFVAWALEVGGPDVRATVEDAFRRAIRAHRNGPRAAELAGDPLRLADHGRLDATEQRRIELYVLEQVVDPCAREFVERRHAAPEPILALASV